MLLEYQVDVIFGVPGDTSIPFYEALYDARFKIRHVLARDERSAAFMADAYARLTRKPGVCECPSGAGPRYALPGVAEANASSIPVVLITPDIALDGGLWTRGSNTRDGVESSSLPDGQISCQNPLRLPRSEEGTYGVQIVTSARLKNVSKIAELPNCSS
jgi:hypothetical protein